MELRKILNKSCENNARLGVTGLLLYKDGSFMQMLEGERETVEQLYAKIRRDPRHSGIIVLFRGETPEREFPDWSMGFRDLESGDAHELPGFNEFMNTPLDASEFADLSRTVRLFSVFKNR